MYTNFESWKSILRGNMFYFYKFSWILLFIFLWCKKYYFKQLRKILTKLSWVFSKGWFGSGSRAESNSALRPRAKNSDPFDPKPFSESHSFFVQRTTSSILFETRWNSLSFLTLILEIEFRTKCVGWNFCSKLLISNNILIKLLIW